MSDIEPDGRGTRVTRIAPDGTRIERGYQSSKLAEKRRFPNPEDDPQSVELAGVWLSAHSYDQLVRRAQQSGLSPSQILETFVVEKANRPVV